MPTYAVATCARPRRRPITVTRNAASKRRGASSSPEDEVHRPHHAQPRPEKVRIPRLAHVERSERNEHRERDHFLKDLELREREARRADAVRRHLHEVLEERDAPAFE